MKVFFEKIIFWVFTTLIKIHVFTLRIKFIDKNGLLASKKHNAIIPLWHNRLVFTTAIMGRKLDNCVTIASQSKDGRYAEMFVNAFNLTAVRGSSSRGGARALLQLHRELKAGKCVAITVDGPRGPKYEIKSGIFSLAIKNDLPIIPFILNSDSCWQLNNWDNTQIPKPFSKVTFILGDAIKFDKGSSIEEMTEILKSEMLALTIDKKTTG